jgi:hypothetical protein
VRSDLEIRVRSDIEHVGPVDVWLADALVGDDPEGGLESVSLQDGNCVADALPAIVEGENDGKPR